MTSYLDTTKRKLFELRFDQLSTDQTQADFVSRDGNDASGIVQGYHPAIPENLWLSVTGKGTPAVISLFRWDSLTQRQEMVSKQDPSEAPRLQRSESWVLIDSPANKNFPPAQEARSGHVHEMRIQKALNGSVPEAADALARFELDPAVQRGAEILGIYELAIGPNRPVLISFLAWPEEVDPSQAWAEIDGAEAFSRQRDAERTRYRRRLFHGTEQYFLHPITFRPV